MVGGLAQLVGVDKADKPDKLNAVALSDDRAEAFCTLLLVVVPLAAVRQIVKDAVCLVLGEHSADLANKLLVLNGYKKSCGVCADGLQHVIIRFEAADALLGNAVDRAYAIGTIEHGLTNIEHNTTHLFNIPKTAQQRGFSIYDYNISRQKKTQAN